MKKLVISILSALILSACIFGSPRDIDIPPAPQRTDLLYGYYGTMHAQASETKNHVNVLWEAKFQGLEKAADNMTEAAMPTILDVANEVMVKFQPAGRNYRYNPQAEQNLTVLFDYFRQRDVLKYVYALVPIDEPNTNAENAAELQKALDMMHTVAARYPELIAVKYATIYAAKPQPYELKEQFDLIGVDDYEVKSEIFANGTYAELIRDILPHQKTMLLPGGAFGQDPTPFLNFANGNPEVGALIPFTWLDPMQAADQWVGIGNDNNPLKARYVEIGHLITGK